MELGSKETYDLVYHNENPGFGMFRAFWIAVNGNTQALIESLFCPVAITSETGTFRINRSRIEEEYISPSKFCEDVDVVDDSSPYTLQILIDDKIRINVDHCTSLS